MATAAVVLPLALAGCGIPPGRPSLGVVPGEPAHAEDAAIVFLGDSILNIARDHIAARAPAGDAHSVIAENGKTISEMAERLPPVLDRRATWFVVQLGTNDAANHNQHARPDLQALTAALELSTCVIWVTVHEHLRDDPIATSIAADLNAAMADAALARDGHALYDWNSTLRGEPDGPDGLVYDGAHPTDAGKERLARDLWDAIDTACTPRDRR